MPTREQVLQGIITLVASELQGLPPGRVAHQRADFWRYKGPQNLKSLKGPDNQLLHDLVLRCYLEDVQKAALQELNSILNYQKTAPVLRAEQIYDALSEYRRELIRPIVPSPREYVDNWLDQPYPSHNPIPLDDKYPTGVSRCPYVRSKSEIWEVQGLSDQGVAFLYEFPLKLMDMHGIPRTVYPDFTILNQKTHELIYWEHFGKMDDPEYLANVRFKQQLYACNDIYGSSLIQTFESSSDPLTMAEVKAVIRDIKKRGG